MNRSIRLNLPFYKAVRHFTVLFLLLSVNPAFTAPQGIFKNEDLQFYIELQSETYKRYQYTSISCFVGSAGFLPSVGTVQNSTLDNYYLIGSSEDSLYLKRPQDDTLVWLEPVEKLPYACKGMPVDTAVSNFYIFWQTISEVYNFSHLERHKWTELFAKYLPTFIDFDLRLFDSRETENLTLFDTFSNMLKEIGDPHIFLLAPDIQKSVYADEERFKFPEHYVNSKQKRKFAFKQASAFGRKPQWFANQNLIISSNTNLLYINPITFSSYQSDGSFSENEGSTMGYITHAIRQKLTPKTHVVVDLRLNDGGSIDYSNAISSCFSEVSETVTYIKSELKGQSIFTPLSSNSRGGVKPASITILTSRYTASAAEYLVLNLKELGATIIGESTRGAFSPVVLKTLPNGWYLGVPPFLTYDKNSLPLPEKVGFSPDIKVSWSLNFQDSLINSYQLSEWREAASLTPIVSEK